VSVPTTPRAAFAFAIVLGAAHAEAQPAPPPPQPAPAAPAPLAMPFGAMFQGMSVDVPLPVATPPSPAALETMRLLDQAKLDDSGRGLSWVWVDAQGGFEQLGMQALNGGNKGFVAGFADTSGSGGVVSVGAGARLLFFTLLARGRVGVFGSGQLYRAGAEAGFHIPLGRVEPRLALGLGYAGMGGLHDATGGVGLSIRGFYTRAEAGLDYYPAPVFSVGLGVSGELLGLSRAALSSAAVTQIKGNLAIPASLRANADLLAQGGTGWGGTLAVTAVTGLHF
jgi:hypothetical protein